MSEEERELPGVSFYERSSAEDHFLVLVYPFQHGFRRARPGSLPRERRGRPERDTKRLGKLLDMWEASLARTKPPGVPEDLQESLGPLGVFDDSYFFLPHVRQFLFPEFTKHPQEAWQEIPYDGHARLSLESHLDRLARPGDAAGWYSALDAIHLTLRGQWLDQIRHWEVRDAREPAASAIGCTLLWSDLHLMPYHVGLLSLCVRIGDPEATGLGSAAPASLRDIHRLALRLHLVHPLYVGHRLAEVTVGGAAIDVRRIVEFLLQGAAPTGDEIAEERERDRQPRFLDRVRRRIRPPAEREIVIETDFRRFLEVPRGKAILDETGPGSDVPSAQTYTLSSYGQIYGSRMLTYLYARAPALSAADGAQAWAKPANYGNPLEQYVAEISN